MQNAKKLNAQQFILTMADTSSYGGGGMRTEQPSVPEGSFCSTTNRIVLASPFPNQFQDLMGELSSSCFDLFVLHRLEPVLLRESGADVLIVDLTHPMASEDILNLECLSTMQRPGFSIVYLTRRDQQTDLYTLPVQGEVLVWPLEVGEIVQMLQDMINTHPPAADEQHRPGMYCFKDLCIDVKRMIVIRQEDRIELTKTEFELLHLLLTADGSVYSREELMEKVWGSSFLGSSNTVDVHIKTIRKKLGDSATSPKYIATVRGVGYRLAI
ncbi:winged helix family transcriptional regulator [Marinicrinis lubricantis]|uniref:Winged helix-turn-helix domain-containing protein n=1 Tax=Marinicrinis lubricantis TaxID=2086470 RepID=A0ABW1IV77_9BACL